MYYIYINTISLCVCDWKTNHSFLPSEVIGCNHHAGNSRAIKIHIGGIHPSGEQGGVEFVVQLLQLPGLLVLLLLIGNNQVLQILPATQQASHDWDEDWEYQAVRISHISLSL